MDQLIFNKDYIASIQVLNELGKVYGNKEDYNMYNLYEIHLKFLLKEYESTLFKENRLNEKIWMILL